MVREQIKSDYTDDEIKNLENKKCWCGKPRTKFDKGMRVYCCIDHRNQWYERTISWGQFKDEVLDEQGKKCKKCGAVKGDNIPKRDKAVTEWMDKIKSMPDFKQMLNETRIKQLHELEEKYEQIMDDNYLIEHNLYWNYRDKVGNIPHEFDFEVRFDVDHILAICNGGDQWDKKNLQVLCTDCHKVKTKSDMKLFRSKKKK